MMKTKFTFLLFAFLCAFGATSAQGFSFSGNGTTIPDAGCGSNEVVLTCMVQNVGKLDFARKKGIGYLYMDITHPYDGDLNIALESPEGTVVNLTRSNGGSGANYTQTSFVSWNSGNPITSGTPPFSGNYDPEESLWLFDGEWADGEWKLIICDDAVGDVGTFNFCSLWFSVTPDAQRILQTDFTSGSGSNRAHGQGAFPTSSFYNQEDMYGLIDHAYRFDGTNSLQLDTDNGTLNPTNGVSMAAWVKPSDVSAIHNIIGKSNAGYTTWYRMGLWNGEWYASVKINGTDYYIRGGTPVANQWAHIAFTYEVGGNMLLYLNGEVIGTLSASTTAIPNLEGEGNWRIGSAPWSSSVSAYKGTMDKLAVWNFGAHEVLIRDHMSAYHNHCRSAIPLNVGGTTCTDPNYGQNFFGYDSGALSPTCGTYNGGDQWFTVQVPSSGDLTVETSSLTSQDYITDPAMEIYSGSCGNLTLIECDDDDGNGAHSKISLYGLTPGETLYVRVWEYNNDDFGFYTICATSPPFVGVEEAILTEAGMQVYPNPAHDYVNIRLSQGKGTTHYTLLDISGKQLEQGTFHGDTYRLSLSNYPTGMYLLNVQTPSATYSEKIILR